MKNPFKLDSLLPKNIAKILSSWTIILILAIVFVFLGITEFGDWQKKRQVDAEIRELTKQASELEEKNRQISDSLSFLNSENFRERIAREQLNLKKEGELVYDTTIPAADPSVNELGEAARSESNFNKWYSYFFKNK